MEDRRYYGESGASYDDGRLCVAKTAEEKALKVKHPGILDILRQRGRAASGSDHALQRTGRVERSL